MGWGLSMRGRVGRWGGGCWAVGELFCGDDGVEGVWRFSFRFRAHGCISL